MVKVCDPCAGLGQHAAVVLVPCVGRVSTKAIRGALLSWRIDALWVVSIEAPRTDMVSFTSFCWSA